MTPRRRRQAAEGLTEAQRRELLEDEWAWFDGWDVSVFPSEAARRRAWEAHGERLTDDYVAENPGDRPEAWWAYDAPEGVGRNRPHATVSDVPDRWRGYAPKVANLEEAGELSPEEAERIRKRGPLW